MHSNGTWSWQLATFDGPDQPQSVFIMATDSDGLTSMVNFDVVVSNVPPELTISGASTVVVGDSYHLKLSAIDPGKDTITSWSVDWETE